LHIVLFVAFKQIVFIPLKEIRLYIWFFTIRIFIVSSTCIGFKNYNYICVVYIYIIIVIYMCVNMCGFSKHFKNVKWQKNYNSEPLITGRFPLFLTCRYKNTLSTYAHSI